MVKRKKNLITIRPSECSSLLLRLVRFFIVRFFAENNTQTRRNPFRPRVRYCIVQFGCDTKENVSTSFVWNISRPGTIGFYPRTCQRTFVRREILLATDIILARPRAVRQLNERT